MKRISKFSKSKKWIGGYDYEKYGLEITIKSTIIENFSNKFNKLLIFSFLAKK